MRNAAGQLTLRLLDTDDDNTKADETNLLLESHVQEYVGEHQIKISMCISCTAALRAE